MSTTSFDAATALRLSGLRVTRPRLAVLETLQAEPHQAADRIAEVVRDRLGSVSTQAVYDVLHACTDAGLVRRIEPAGSPSIYELQTDDNHHHAVCRACGAVADVGCAVGAAPCLSPYDDHGFVIDEAEVVFWGLCPQCVRNQRREATQQRIDTPVLPPKEAAV